MKKNFLTLWVAEHFNRMPREVWGVYLWNDSKLTCTLSCATCLPCSGRVIGLVDLQKSLSTVTILWKKEVMLTNRWTYSIYCILLAAVSHTNLNSNILVSTWKPQSRIEIFVFPDIILWITSTISNYRLDETRITLRKVVHAVTPRMISTARQFLVVL